MDSGADKLDFLGLLLAATNDGIVDWDIGGHQTHYNDRWLFLLGWDESGFVLTPNTWRELIHEEERPEVEKALADHLESAWPFVQVVRMRHRTLGWRWILMRGMARRNVHGQPSRMVIIFADIDERVRAERQAQALSEAIPDTILSVRTDGTVLAAKEGSLREGGSTTCRGARALWATLQASEAGARIMEGVRTAVASEEVVRIPCRLQGARGESTHYDVRIVRSGPDHVVCIVRDVTRETNSEEDLARGRKLEAIGQLAAGLAHEINTPLQYIGDNLEFARNAVPSLLSLIDDFHRILGPEWPPETAAAIARREEDADLPFLREALQASLSGVVDGLASIARTVQAMKPFENASGQGRVAVDLNVIVENAVVVATRGWTQFVEIFMKLDRQLPQVHCIPGEVAQAVMNLATNAAQAVADKVAGLGGKGRITVETLHKPDEGMIEIRVDDDGVGIPESIRAKIFDPFFSTRPPGKGSGQGLAQVHAAIIRMHGGSVDFHSQEGKGATFLVKIPLREGSVTSALAAADDGGGRTL
jgi:PAS domain S-box-containing protein